MSQLIKTLTSLLMFSVGANAVGAVGGPLTSSSQVLSEFQKQGVNETT